MQMRCGWGKGGHVDIERSGAFPTNYVRVEHAGGGGRLTWLSPSGDAHGMEVLRTPLVKVLLRWHDAGKGKKMWRARVYIQYGRTRSRVR